MSGTWASGWATGDIPTAAEFSKGVACVASTRLSASAASISFASLPQVYAHLMVVAFLRGDVAATNTSTLLRFNGDSTNSYDYQRHGAAGATVLANDTIATSGIFVGNAPGNTALGSHHSTHRLLIPSYTYSDVYKTCSAQAGYMTDQAANSIQVENVFGGWRSIAAITQITLVPASGNFVSGSHASVYVMGS